VACGLAPAKIEQFDVQEVGDFAVFTSPTTLSIESNKSSVIPMFSRTVKDAELILLYKNTSNPTRPFRALKFVNPVDGHTLGKGKCTIFEENILAGECILETAKPGESQLLPFALETGVSVFRNVVDTRQDLIFIKFSNGVFTRKFRNSCKSLYRIKNNKNESFKFMIDYNFNYANVENVNLTLEEYTTETLNKGQRIIFTLEPNADIEFNLVESEVVNQEYMFKVNNLIEAVQQIFVTEDPSKFIPQFSQIKEILGSIEGLAASERETNTIKQTALQEENRLRANIASLSGKDSSLINDWAKQLDKVGKSIQEYDRNILAIQKQRNDLAANLDKFLAEVEFSKDM
jgi:hypothetical protein